MITKDNFKQVLQSLGFKENKNGFSKQFHNDLTCSMQVDFNAQKLIYPDKIKGRERNDNFAAPENFVVFECVCRLLEKGYRPEHIELEKVWTLGHEQKSGRADIIVYHQDLQEVLLIIECKTAGREFDCAKKDTLADGGQLFSYWQQERSTKWLALYASDFKDDNLTYKCSIINCSDDANIAEMAKKDKAIKIYTHAYTATEKFEVWKETYNTKLYEDLIFGDETSAYKIGVKPLRKKDLRKFSTDDDKIVNRFEEILRHNNVSDKENAFNRLVAMFICKLVDEIEKTDFEEVEFQYKQGSDTYESLQDRLQRLHTKGMAEFMKEKIYYIPADYAENLFTQYTGQKRKEAIADLNQTIRILKFYSNNDFAFKDVHNEELFYQNGKILVEMVQLFERYRIVYPSKHQFLGDLFEQLLNKGFKQNEGQFFTPTPITRFIWDSLPLENYIANNGLPRVIDYACGAGHFLTEAIEAINAVHKNADNNWAEKHIFGIEKDYRLARVSKISLFMNGAGSGNIIFADGLENNPEKGIENASFDILVANPPYSVSAFKAHLNLKNNPFELFDRISNDGSEIETLFVERIAQLLKPKGIAAVVLPSSILSNNSGSYTGAREQLLQHFYIRSIVCFGSKTFGATGTNTIVLFLEKYNEPPRRCKMAEDSASAIMTGENLSDWDDQQIFDDYLKQIGVAKEDYFGFLSETASLDDLRKHDYFKMYISAFEASKQTFAKKLTAEEIENETKRRFYAYAKTKEAEKVLYFSLVREQKTLVITAPADNAEQKTFLGYDWSNRKGAEGIIINTPGGKLYNDSDRFARGTLACFIRNTFADAQTQITDDLQKYAATYRLADMLDFSRTDFDKAIRTSAVKKVEIKSKFPLVKLGEVAEVIKGKSITSAQAKDGNIKVVAGGLDFAYMHNVANRKANTITISASGANAGFVNFWKEEIFASDCTTIRGRNDLHTSFLYEFLQSIQDQVYNLQKGAAQPHVYPDDIKALPIPDIDEDIQQQIVTECEKVDAEYNEAKTLIEAKKAEIEKVMGNVKGDMKKLEQLLISINGNTTKIGTEQINERGKYPVITQENGNLIAGYTNNNKPIDDLPLIVFGDHSCTFKYIDFEFVRGADGTQLIKVDEKNIKTKFLYNYLQFVPITNSGKYERHFKYLKTVSIPLPPLAEQQKIVAEIETYETEIAQAKAVMAGCAARKKEILEKYL